MTKFYDKGKVNAKSAPLNDESSDDSDGGTTTGSITDSSGELVSIDAYDELITQLLTQLNNELSLNSDPANEHANDADLSHDSDNEQDCDVSANNDSNKEYRMDIDQSNDAIEQEHDLSADTNPISTQSDDSERTIFFDYEQHNDIDSKSNADDLSTNEKSDKANALNNINDSPDEQSSDLNHVEEEWLDSDLNNTLINEQDSVLSPQNDSHEPTDSSDLETECYSASDNASYDDAGSQYDLENNVTLGHTTGLIGLSIFEKKREVPSQEVQDGDERQSNHM